MAQSPSYGAFSQPNDFSLELADLERRRQLAQALQAQGQSPLGQTETVGGWAIPKSPLEGLAKIAQSASGAYQQNKLTEQEKDIAKRYQLELSDTLSRATTAGTGTPATPGTPAYDLPPDVAGPTQEAQPGNPAVPGDQAKMASILMGHPATQAAGTQMMLTNANRQALIQALSGGQAAPSASSGAPAAAGAPAPQGATGGPAPSTA